jgi:hypothetical protein
MPNIGSNTRKNLRKNIKPRGIVSSIRSTAAKERYTRKKLRNINNDNFANKHNGRLRILHPSPRIRNNTHFNIGDMNPSLFTGIPTGISPPAKPHYPPPNRNTRYSYHVPLQNTPGKSFSFKSNNLARPKNILIPIQETHGKRYPLMSGNKHPSRVPFNPLHRA